MFLLTLLFSAVVLMLVSLCGQMVTKEHQHWTMCRYNHYIIVTQGVHVQIQHCLLHPHLPGPHVGDDALLPAGGAASLERGQDNPQAGHDSSCSNGEEKNRQKKGMTLSCSQYKL